MMTKYVCTRPNKRSNSSRWLFLFCVGFFLQGCDSYETTITYDGRQTAPEKPPDYVPKQNWWLGSVFGQKTVDPAKICKGAPVQAVKHSQNFFWDLVISGVTLGIYMPYTTEIWCASKEESTMQKTDSAPKGIPSPEKTALPSEDTPSEK